MSRGRPAQKPGFVQQQLTTTVHSGPLPQAQDFGLYGQVLADAPTRILAMAEKEQAARIEYDRNAQDKQYRLNRMFLWVLALVQVIGQIMATGMVLFVIWVAYQLLSDGKTITGMAALIGAMGSIVGLFVYKSRSAAAAHSGLASAMGPTQAGAQGKNG